MPKRNRRASYRAALRRNKQTAATQPTAETLTAAATADDPRPLVALDKIPINTTAPNVSEPPSPQPQSQPPRPLSDLRLAANRENAQKSTGPITREGKFTSSRNALKHGLTGSTILLDSDDAEAYQTRLDAHVEEFQPVTFEERRLVQSIHDSAWRLDRIISLESTIYAKGRIELELCFEDLPAEQRKNFIQLETVTRYAKELRNLHIQESRLQRQRAKDIQTLNQLTARRQAGEEAEAVEEAEAGPENEELTAPALANQPHGFEFSNTLIEPCTPTLQAVQKPSFSLPDYALDHERSQS